MEADQANPSGRRLWSKSYRPDAPARILEETWARPRPYVADERRQTERSSLERRHRLQVAPASSAHEVPIHSATAPSKNTEASSALDWMLQPTQLSLFIKDSGPKLPGESLIGTFLSYGPLN
ncbi:hypothetical protein PCASD_23577 [Puccinia coronata f. sp. avenae]|uniref:Uncharacterized protein n=1 Tax=Puccinia coronata f. sp. avenae TaxID=200324 RepID=A0A2N5SFH6_9BASI|nr:hypothetical protein PCASD_23577 [Puccinia coronata f. sp. avenae]